MRGTGGGSPLGPRVSSRGCSPGGDDARMAPMTPEAALCVFAKPPRAGEAKTRLTPALGAEGAARLARAFLQDTWALVTRVQWATPVLASAGPWPEGLLPGPLEVWPQGEGDLG